MHALSPRTVVFILTVGLPYWYHSPVQLDGNSQDPETLREFVVRERSSLFNRTIMH